MRIFILAIALVLATGVALPTSAESRAPTKAHQWGCTFRAGFLYEAFPGVPTVWVGHGWVKRCDTKQKAIMTVTLYQSVPGRRDRVRSRERFVGVLSRYGIGRPYGVRGGTCSVKGSLPDHPFYVVMKVKRIGKPGVVRVASRNRWNPCPKGTWPHRR